MKKEAIYFAAMLLAIIAGLLLWEVSPAIAERLHTETRYTDMIAYAMALPAIVFSGLFNEARDQRKKTLCE
jgi:hypothetical protein